MKEITYDFDEFTSKAAFSIQRGYTVRVSAEWSTRGDHIKAKFIASVPYEIPRLHILIYEMPVRLSIMDAEKCEEELRDAGVEDIPHNAFAVLMKYILWKFELSKEKLKEKLGRDNVAEGRWEE